MVERNRSLGIRLLFAEIRGVLIGHDESTGVIEDANPVPSKREREGRI
jgi:hypothetical protein